MPKRDFRTKALLVAGEDADRVAGWNFDSPEPSDLEGSNDLTRTGHAMLTTGLHGRSSRVFGSTDYAGTGPGDATTTVSAWVKPAGAVTNQAIWDFANASNERRSMSFDGTGKALIAYGAGVQRTSIAAPPLRAEHWHHLAAIHRPSGWDEISPAADPGLRILSVMAYDPVRQVTVLFGGQEAVIGNTVFNDLWEYDGANWTKIRENVAPSTGLPTPDAALGGQMVYHETLGAMVFFGGIVGTPGNFLEGNETWTWDGTNWTQLSPPTSPSTRDRFGAAYDSARGVMVVFGGFGSNTNRQDTWEFDGSTWTEVITPTLPAVRRNLAMAFDRVRNRTVLHGGLGNGATVHDDTWEYDGTDWTQQSPATATGDIGGHVMWFDGERILIFGGTNFFTADFNDTWEWDGTDWTKVTDVGPPSVRYFLGGSYDSDRDIMVLYGGWFFENPALVQFDETWEYQSRGTRLFIDGQEQTMDVEASAGAAGSPSVLAIGDLLAGSANWDGEINSLEIRSRELTEAEVDALYQKGAPVVSLSDTLADSDVLGPVTAGQIPTTIWRVGSGSWSTVVDPALSCATAGFCSTAQKLAFGTWEFSVSKPDAVAWEVAFAAGARAAVGDASQNGYSLVLDATEALILRRRTAGAATTLFATGAGFLAADTLYQLRATRDLDGELFVYVKGGIFDEWTLVSPTTGTNPVTDANHVSSEYWVNDCGAGVKLSPFKVQHGVIVTP